MLQLLTDAVNDWIHITFGGGGRSSYVVNYMTSNYEVQITDFLFTLPNTFHLNLLFYIGRNLGLLITVAKCPNHCSLLNLERGDCGFESHC